MNVQVTSRLFSNDPNTPVLPRTRIKCTVTQVFATGLVFIDAVCLCNLKRSHGNVMA